MHTDRSWFESRPRRFHTCGHCQGQGKVEKGYALAPAEYVIDAPNNAIRAQVVGSYDIGTACLEASEIAKRAHEPVAFEFNGSCVIVTESDDPVEISRQWWIKTYGETPEQSAARR